MAHIVFTRGEMFTCNGGFGYVLEGRKGRTLAVFIMGPDANGGYLTSRGIIPDDACVALEQELPPKIQLAFRTLTTGLKA